MDSLPSIFVVSVIGPTVSPYSPTTSPKASHQATILTSYRVLPRKCWIMQLGPAEDLHILVSVVASYRVIDWLLGGFVQDTSIVVAATLAKVIICGSVHET